MWNMYKSVGVIAAICVLILLYLSMSPASVISDAPISNALTQTNLEKAAEVQPAPTPAAEDQKDGSTNSSTKSVNAQVVPVQPGKDPFKEFLEKQKQNAKDQVVSPFGKN
jgi:hypothetical protein